MRNIQYSVTIAAIVVVLTLQFALADEAAEVDAVRQANTTFLETVGTRDIEAMTDLWRQTDYVRAIHPFRSIDDGWDDVREGFQALYEIFPKLSSTMTEPHIRVADDVAWVTGHEEFQGVLQSGDLVSVMLRTNKIFEREGDGWLLVHHQVSPPPDE